MLRSSVFSSLLAFTLFAFSALPRATAADAPQLVQKDGRYALLVDGRPDGEPIDVLSPNSRNTLEADKSAFVALISSALRRKPATV